MTTITGNTFGVNFILDTQMSTVVKNMLKQRFRHESLLGLCFYLVCHYIKHLPKDNFEGSLFAHLISQFLIICCSSKGCCQLVVTKHNMMVNAAITT